MVMWAPQAFADQLIMSGSGLLVKLIFDLCNLRFQLLGFAAQVFFLSRWDLLGSAPEALAQSQTRSAVQSSSQTQPPAAASASTEATCAAAPSGGGVSGFIVAGTVACSASGSASESIRSCSVSSRHDISPFCFEIDESICSIYIQ
jgi:hypothetical protein